MINYKCFPFCGELGLSGLNMQIQLMYHMKSKGRGKALLAFLISLMKSQLAQDNVHPGVFIKH